MDFTGLSCQSEGNCTAVGSEIGATDWPIAATEVDGEWGAATVFSSANNYVMWNVSCSSIGNCLAVGGHNGGFYEPFYVFETNGE